MHCGLFHAAFLARHAQQERGRNASLGALLLLGRLVAYVMFGLLLGLVATSGMFMVRQWVLMTVLGTIMLAYAVFPKRESDQGGCVCARMPRKLMGGALMIGFVSGLAPCPPFLASGVIALHSRGVGAAMLTLVAFFIGTSVYLLPVWFGLTTVSAGMRRRLRTFSRVIAAAVALYAFASASAGFRRSAGTGKETPADPSRPPDARPLLAAAAGKKEPAKSGDSKGGKEKPETQETKVQVPPPADLDVEPLFPKEPPTKKFTEALLRRLNLSLKEAMYWKSLEDGLVQCELCPTKCVLENGQQGMCRARVNIDGTLRTIVYGRPVAVHIDPIEKKPLFHVIPSSRAFSIATAGCNLGCVFCQNFEISQAAPEDIRRHDVPPEKVVAIAKSRDCEGIAYTYTEPTIFYEYMLDTAALARANGMKNYWITCGQIEEAPLLELCKVLDAANVDLKGFSDEFYVKYCNAHLFPVLRTLKILRREKVFFEITNLIVPGGNDDPDMIRDMCRWIVQVLGPDTPLHFSRFHPAYKLTRRPATPVKTLTMARKIAREEGLRYVYIGNVRGRGTEDTFCPVCEKTLIRRAGYLVLENHVKKGRCEFCGAPIAGVWK